VAQMAGFIWVEFQQQISPARFLTGRKNLPSNAPCCSCGPAGGIGSFDHSIEEIDDLLWFVCGGWHNVSLILVGMLKCVMASIPRIVVWRCTLAIAPLSPLWPS